MITKQNEVRKTIAAAFSHTIPVLTGFLVLGITYGVLMKTNGYATIWAVLMSAIAFCGSMQFVAITLLTTAFAPWQALLMSFMVNARHLFYGISLLEKYKGLGRIRALLIFWLCDETFSIVSSVSVPEGIEPKYFYFTISALDYIYWVVGTFIGGVLGDFVHFDTTGLDFVLTALFVVLLMEQLKKKENWIPAVIGILATIIALVVFGADNLVIPSMVLILVVLLMGRKAIV